LNNTPLDDPETGETVCAWKDLNVQFIRGEQCTFSNDYTMYSLHLN